MTIRSFAIACILCLTTFALNAQFHPPAGEEGSHAIHRDSSILVAWAKNCEVTRGYQNIALPDSGVTTAGQPSYATGESLGQGIVSLGDGGVATLEFSYPIYDGEGPDFAVFENAFIKDFLELAFVEVSSNGKDFIRFASVSNTPTDKQLDAFGRIDARQVNNLAGKYKVDYGTPFDLAELADSTGLDIMGVRYVRIIDVVGSLDPEFASYDSKGQAINDPWPTAFETGGFDLEAVGAIHTSDPSSVEQSIGRQTVSIYPNPLNQGDEIRLWGTTIESARLFSYQGVLVKEWESGLNSLKTSGLSSGAYVLVLSSKKSSVRQKILIR